MCNFVYTWYILVCSSSSGPSVMPTARYSACKIARHERMRLASVALGGVVLVASTYDAGIVVWRIHCIDTIEGLRLLL